jgi:hypothetical protein
MKQKGLFMDQILVAIIVLLAVAYLFRRFYVTFKGKETMCGCGSCASNCGQGAISCETCDVDSIEMKKFE